MFLTDFWNYFSNTGLDTHIILLTYKILQSGAISPPTVEIEENGKQNQVNIAEAQLKFM